MERHDKQWFIDRIGKRVFRTKAKCKCATCVRIGQTGLTISDDSHAHYLYDCQNHLELFYSDEPIIQPASVNLT